ARPRAEQAWWMGPRRFAAGAPLLRPARAPRVPGVSPATLAPPSRRRRAPAPNREGGWAGGVRGGGAAPTACPCLASARGFSCDACPALRRRRAPAPNGEV